LMPGGDSRYVIMILPFTLLAMATYFHDSRKLRQFLGIFLLLTISVSLYRLIWWDNIYFKNNQSYVSLRNKMSEPYELVSEVPKYSYYIFGKPSKDLRDIKSSTKYIVIFGQEEYNKEILKSINKAFDIHNIEYLNDKIIAATSREARFKTIKITTNTAVQPSH
jgi:hypothetical protein